MQQEPIPDVADGYNKAYQQGKRDERQRIINLPANPHKGGIAVYKWGTAGPEGYALGANIIRTLIS